MLCPQQQKNNADTSPESGFTLIEVMVALVIFAFGILAVLGMQATAITGGYKAQNISEASGIGANKIEELMSHNYASLADGTATVDEKYTLNWDVTIDPSEAPPHTTSIHLTVQWNEGGQTHKVAYDFLRAQDI